MAAGSRRRSAVWARQVVEAVYAETHLAFYRAWLLMLFFGIGTGAYTLVLAWLPPFYTELGWSAAHSGLLLGALTLVEVLAGLVVSSIINRFPDRRPLLLAVLLFSVGQGAADEGAQGVVGQGVQDDDTGAGEQRRVDLEVQRHPFSRLATL